MEDHSTNVTPLQDSGEISTTGSSLSIGQNTSQMMNQSFLSLGLMMFLMELDHVLHYFYLIQILPLPQQSNLWFFTFASRARIMELCLHLHTIRKGGLSMLDYMLRIRNNCDNLTAVGEIVLEQDHIMEILGTLLYNAGTCFNFDYQPKDSKPSTSNDPQAMTVTSATMGDTSWFLDT
ncbi:hypothetical protein CK203_027874 [Vitis vinifera]|uniref:Uncharacterized protein n=1 Tax=Vitis vinifera TaxID=29760 RepID=A0A438J3L1_VITVI|nr:hypothetical protein CK203_027874 [Vitis vinifera]